MICLTNHIFCKISFFFRKRGNLAVNLKKMTNFVAENENGLLRRDRLMAKVKNSELLLSYIREGRTMTQREKLWLIVSLSIPSILAQISATVMFFIDASMVGHLGAKASAAIGIVETSGWLMGGLASAANMGFSVQVAHFIGANDFEAARRVLRQSLVCCTIWAVMISLTSVIIAPFLPYWMGGSADIAHDASLYFAIFGVAGLFFQMEGLAGSMLKCSGNMKIPSMLNILMCLMDVVFNYLFIYILHLGVAGAAIGTGLAELVTAGLMLWFLLVRSPMLSLVKRQEEGTAWRNSFRPTPDVVGTAFKIGAPMGFQHLLMGGAQIVSTIIVAPLGTVAIAANSLAITVESLCYMPGYGIAEAATTLVGQGVGAGQRALTRAFAYMSVGLGIGVMTLMGLLMWVFAPELMAIMSPVEEIIAQGADALRIEAWAEPMFAAAIVTNGVFIGTGNTIVPAVMSLTSMWLVRLTLAATLAPVYGLRGVWTAMAIELTFRGSIFLVRLIRGRWLPVASATTK
jgi:putative MATE family efflux protein